MRGALLVGIDKYPQHAQLNGCVNDATELAALLSRHEDGTRNFEIELKTNVPTRGALADMYFATQHSEACKLTSLKKQYWHMLKQQKI